MDLVRLLRLCGLNGSYKILTVALDPSKVNNLKSVYKYFDMVIETNSVGQDFGGYLSALNEVENTFGPSSSIHAYKLIPNIFLRNIWLNS